MRAPCVSSAAPGGRGSEVQITLQYYPPAGVLGATIAKLFGEEPSIQIADDLRRLKRLMEPARSPRLKASRTAERKGDTR